MYWLRKIIALNEREKDRDVDRKTTRVRENNKEQALMIRVKKIFYSIPPSFSRICGARWPASAKNDEEVSETMGNETPNKYELMTLA